MACKGTLAFVLLVAAFAAHLLLLALRFCQVVRRQHVLAHVPGTCLNTVIEHTVSCPSLHSVVLCCCSITELFCSTACQALGRALTARLQGF